MNIFKSLLGTSSSRELKKNLKITNAVLELDEQYGKMSDADLKAKTQQLRARLAGGETVDDIAVEAFATSREAMWRVLEKKPFPVQVQGALILHQGRIAEMKTGEGKTFTAVLPAYLNALTGKPVHIVTVNDYLAKFQGELMSKVFHYLGMTTGIILHDLNNTQRKAAYACDVTYATNNELGFDYLRDNMAIYKRDMVQRGHGFAIVDEVDSILIDEARTPLIISGQGDKSTELYDRADKFVATLTCKRVKKLESKEDHEEIEGDYVVDEKERSSTILPSGIEKAEKFFNVENLSDPDNATLYHHINQALRARGVMQRDVDYVVKAGQVIIVDEFTGRLMTGRRYSEGLHQAIEAKEKVKVEHESKTVATITFQNYFRLYPKLSGMTGTATTEADEFAEIYRLDVIEIPTNLPMIRTDNPDVVYKTEQGKFRAVIEQVEECHAKGQPVLVGTISIEKSELLSSMLKKKGIAHVVLNAKYHEKEAEIVAQAGKKGAVTIATNMAGRGTDILLGGNSEYLARAELRRTGFTEELIAEADGHADTDDAEVLDVRTRFKELCERFKTVTADEGKEVITAGGLFIIGTERHESRRIDNQLRGRAGRQGDPGESRFFISLEDDLMRLFGSERIMNVMNSLGVDEDTPIEQKMLSSAIESAQRRIESRNFEIRKHTLQYDDVMNKMREIIYTQRLSVLNNEDLHASIDKMITGVITEAVSDGFGSENFLQDELQFKHILEKLYFMVKPETIEKLKTDFLNVTADDMNKMFLGDAQELYRLREEEVGSDRMREIERILLLQNVDGKWMDHIDAMHELRRGIGLRAYGQNDPVIEYKREGFDMFDAMVAGIREDTVRMLMTFRLREEEPKRKEIVKVTALGTGGGDGTVKKQPAHAGKKPGPNDPCPCGSGKKYKKCCYLKENEQE